MSVVECKLSAVVHTLHVHIIIVNIGRGALRLFRNGLTSTSYTSGILEIYYGSWGNICSYELDFYVLEADVACHQLGYSGSSSYGSSGSISRFVSV